MISVDAISFGVNAGPLQAGEVCLVVHPDNQGWTFVTAASGQQVNTRATVQPTSA